MPPSQPRKLSPLVLALLCLAGVAFNAVVLGPALAHSLHGQNDFLGLYPGGRLAGTNGVYDPAQNAAVQQKALGYSKPQLLFCRPPYYAALMWPIARLPYFPAYLAFQALMLAAVATFVCVWPDIPTQTTLLAACWSLPLAAALAIGQDDAVLLAVLAVTATLLNRRRNFAAGLVFCLCAIKPHLFLLTAVWIVARQMWRFAGGLAVGGVVLAALSLAAAGPDGFAAFLRTVTTPVINPGLEVMPNLNGLFHGNVTLEVAGAVVAAVLVGVAARSGSQQWALGALLLGGLLTSHHAYIPDCTLLLPAALAMASEADRPWQRYLALFLLAPIVYVGMFAGIAFVATACVVVLCGSFAIVPRTAR